MVKRRGFPPLAFAAVLIACLAAFPRLAVGAGAPPPAWVGRVSSRPLAEWSGWRNALRPRGRPAPALALAADGTTGYVIVIPVRPGAPERRAAGELAYWLGRLTGASFPLVPDSEAPRPRELSVGRTNRLGEAETAALAEAGDDGYAIAVHEERVFLLGGGPAGPLHAVFALLEEDLGVRWYAPDPAISGNWARQRDALAQETWPDEGVSRVTSDPSLRAAIVPRVVRPGFPLRELPWALGYRPWALRNRLNGGYADRYGQHGFADGGLASHTFHRLVPPEQFFETNPEYYSLVDRQRRWEDAQLCLANPGVAAVAAGNVLAALRPVPPLRRRVSVSAMDWLNDCRCPECLAAIEETGSYGGLLLDFVNRVAARVNAELPGAVISTLAYRQSKEPPRADMAAAAGVAVRFCTDFGASFTWPYHSFRDEALAEQRHFFERWQQVSPRMHLWLYPHQYRHFPAPMPNLEPLAETLHFFSERGVDAVYIQQEQDTGGDSGRAALRYWVFSKLLWDPTLDVTALLLDFIWGYYGPDAAPWVVRYHQLLREQAARHGDFHRPRNWIYPVAGEAMFWHGFIEEARALLDAALAAVDDGQLRARVELLKFGVVYVESVQLHAAAGAAGPAADRARLEEVKDELAAMGARLGVHRIGFYDGQRTVWNLRRWLAELATAAGER